MTGLSSRDRRPLGRSIVHVALVISLAFGALAGAAGYWAVIEAPNLVRSANDPAVIAAARQVARGRILDREGIVLADNERDANGDVYRVYRSRSVSHVVGYASRRYGTAGLERSFSAELSGLSVDPLTDAFRKFSSDPYDPQELELTLSYELQRAAVRALGDRRGAVAMLDPATGEVLVLASTPVYDASAIADPATSAEAFEAARDDPRQPLLPRATLGRYVPGSVFKIVTAMAGLGSGAIEPDTTFERQAEAGADGIAISGYRIREGHALRRGDLLDLYEATEVSSNIWYALAGLETGGDALVEYAGRLGFGAPLPFDLPTAVSQVTNARGDEPGGFVDDVELASAAFGQGETFVTPLQMALVAATVANDGVPMRPRLVSSMSGSRGTRTFGPERLRRVVSEADARVIRDAMELAVEGEYGRRFTTGAKVRGIPTAGKSGTAQLGGEGEPHSWFIGFAPADQPRIAIAVVVEQAGRGGEVAAPLAGEMMTQFFEIYGR
jgi:peptidoglycan glycosyltransferase